ncbi:MAG: GxxExxY protein [Saprospiraceae bacterium]|jgi:GxxExxY protein
MINEQYKYSELTSQIIAAAMEVHSFLGNGFQEVIYQRALSYELDLRKINHEQEFVMPVNYKDIRVGTRRVDFLIEDKISVEIKARTVLEPAHLAQAINYLEAYNLEIGLLINFGETRLKFHRLKNKKYRDKFD